MSKVRLDEQQTAVLRKALSLYVTIGSETGVSDSYVAEAMLREAGNVERVTVRLRDSW